jgi:hypothetical protein
MPKVSLTFGGSGNGIFTILNKWQSSQLPILLLFNI